MLLSGCQTARGPGSGMLSASDSGSGNSSQGDSSRSDSGSGSGNSSQGSGDSSRSDSGSGDSSQSESSQSDSKSGNSSRDSAASSKGSGEPTDLSGRLQSSGSSKGSHSEVSPLASITTMGVTVGGLGLIIWRVFGAAAQAVPPPAAVARAADAYLRSRTHQLREDLALGAGPSIDDLAQLAHIRRENLRLFGQVLRAHREELLALARPATLTPERALAWLERVGALAGTEPRLREDGRAFLTAQGPGE